MWLHMKASKKPPISNSKIPIMYDYLPDFCYTCGLIGHTDRICTIPLEMGTPQQFSKALRFIPEKKSLGDEQ